MKSLLCAASPVGCALSAHLQHLSPPLLLVDSSSAPCVSFQLVSSVASNLEEAPLHRAAMDHRHDLTQHRASERFVVPALFGFQF